MWKEVFQEILWYEKLYHISSIWSVLSLRYWKWKILKPWKNKAWYLFVALSKDWKISNHYIHRLVASSFIKKEDWKNEINHIDWNKSNNSIENLEWCTHKDNMSHCFHILKKGWFILSKGKGNGLLLWKFWYNHPKHIEINQFSKIWEFIKTWWWMREVEKYLWIKNSSISKCCKWQRKTAWGFIWEYTY